MIYLPGLLSSGRLRERGEEIALVERESERMVAVLGPGIRIEGEDVVDIGPEDLGNQINRRLRNPRMLAAFASFEDAKRIPFAGAEDFCRNCLART